MSAVGREGERDGWVVRGEVGEAAHACARMAIKVRWRSGMRFTCRF